MTWVNVGIAAASVVGGALSANAAGDASDAQVKASKQALELQRQQYMNSLAMLEPSRGLGYGAMQDIANLYGYGLPSYTPLAGLQNGWAYPSGIKTQQESPSTIDTLWKYDVVLNPANALAGGIGGIWGDNGSRLPSRYGGTINPTTGTVDVSGKGEHVDQWLTDYLRTGELNAEGLRNKQLKRYEGLIGQIDRLRDSGWTWNPEAGTGGAGTSNPNAPPSTVGITGQPGNMSRFFASPDYQFRLNQTQQAVDRSAAARGGALSGNAVVAGMERAGDLASGEFGNYMNRLFSIAGLNQTATAQANSAGGTYAANAGNLLQQQGDARASGIYGTTNGITNNLNAGLNTWLMYRGGLYGQPGAGGYTLPSDLQGFNYLNVNNPNLYRVGG